MPEVNSAAFIFLLPAGSAHDPSNARGSASVLSELLYRGAGKYDNRSLNQALDNMGLHRLSHVHTTRSSFGGALLSDNLSEALHLQTDILRRPALADDQFNIARALALQSLDSLEDDPRQRIGLLTQQYYLPEPLNHPAPGIREELQALENKTVKKYFTENFTPAGTVLAAAGKVHHDDLAEQVEDLLGSWQGPTKTQIPPKPCPVNNFHQHYDGAQVHIGIMFPSVGYADPDYFKALGAVNILSGGMGSRLFTEVREKRGLCYAVVARHKTISSMGAVQAYVGSSPDRAQEALDVTINELTRLSDGIESDELERAQVGLRASLIMQGESTSARAMAAAKDMVHLGRVRSLEEIEKAILDLTVDDIVLYAQEHKPQAFTVVTIGPKELKIPAA